MHNDDVGYSAGFNPDAIWEIPLNYKSTCEKFSAAKYRNRSLAAILTSETVNY